MSVKEIQIQVTPCGWFFNLVAVSSLALSSISLSTAFAASDMRIYKPDIQGLWEGVDGWFQTYNVSEEQWLTTKKSSTIGMPWTLSAYDKDFFTLTKKISVSLGKTHNPDRSTTDIYSCLMGPQSQFSCADSDEPAFMHGRVSSDANKIYLYYMEPNGEPPVVAQFTIQRTVA